MKRTPHPPNHRLTTHFPPFDSDTHENSATFSYKIIQTFGYSSVQTSSSSSWVIQLQSSPERGRWWKQGYPFAAAVEKRWEWMEKFLWLAMSVTSLSARSAWITRSRRVETPASAVLLHIIFIMVIALYSHVQIYLTRSIHWNTYKIYYYDYSYIWHHNLFVHALYVPYTTTCFMGNNYKHQLNY